MKYKKKLAEDLCDLIASGKYTIEDCCDMLKISKSVFYYWKQTKLDFLDMVEAAERKRYDVIAERAISGMYKLVDVYEYDETKTEYAPVDPKQPDGKQKIIGITRTRKRILPNQQMIQYALNNLKAKDFKTRNQTDHTNNGESFSFGNFLMDNNTVDSLDDIETDTIEK